MSDQGHQHDEFSLSTLEYCGKEHLQGLEIENARLAKSCWQGACKGIVGEVHGAQRWEEVGAVD